MNEKELLNQEKRTDLSEYLPDIIRELESAGKFTAVHTYTCTLNSFMKFWGGENLPMPIHEVFTPGKLKSYQDWLLRRGLSWNTISTYMRTLRAVYNRIFSMISLISPSDATIPILYYNPKLFENVYTKVESRTKRALTERQTQEFMRTDIRSLPEKSRRTLAYFRLMFLFRGMPFIDLAHLRKQDVKGNTITYCRHKTGKQLSVNIPKEAFPLMREFMDMNPGHVYLFPILDGNQEDDQIHYRSYMDALRRFNKILSKIAAVILPGKKVSSYTARHTWATLSFHMGTPVGVISKALGHSSIRVTETYLKPFENDRIDRANDKLIASIVKCKMNNKTNCNAFINSVL